LMYLMTNYVVSERANVSGDKKKLRPFIRGKALWLGRNLDLKLDKVSPRRIASSSFPWQTRATR
jgi:hypothetical protein